MGLPQPIHPLTDHCSVINNNTLYVYSPEGLQSLSLSDGAEWQDLPMGVSVTGGQCVRAVPGGDPNAAALYIVGGAVNETASSWNYPGLQRFSFVDQTWEWVTPVVPVTQNRQNHAATYLNASQQILVYSGSQTTGDEGPSSQTFVISTASPFGVTSFSSTAPPAVKPMLLPWDENHAVMFGGGDQNEAVFTFSPDDGWQNVGVTLTAPFTNQAQIQSTIVFGDDGSKVLETYDMSGTPNKVTRVALLGAGGVVAAPGTTVAPSSRKAKRDLTISNWPSYNGTLAPTAIRTGFSIAQNANDMAVISGGNTDDPLCIFDQRANSWVNATELFTGPQVIIQSTPSATPSSTVPSSSTAPSAAASSSAAATPASTAPNNKSRMLTVLGGTLGAIFGIAAILVILLLLLRCKRERKKRERAAGYIEKDRLSFADRGAEFMSEAGGAVGHNYNNSMNGSQTSLAIVSGRAGNHKRGLGPLGSDASTAGLVTKKSPLGYSEPVEMLNIDQKLAPVINEKPAPAQAPRTAQMEPAPQTASSLGRSRSSGWSRYFTNNEATNLAQMPSGRSTYTSDRTSSNSESIYTDSRVISQPMQAIPPLDVNFNKFEGQRISRVATGSPTLGNSRENLPGQPMQAQLARASRGSSVSSLDHGDPREATANWTPVAGSNFHRPASSAYTDSVRASEVRDGTNSYYFNDGTSSYYPKSNTTSLYPGRLGPADERDSTVTMFPRGVPEPEAGGRGQVGHQDMSWLNLGAGS